ELQLDRRVVDCLNSEVANSRYDFTRVLLRVDNRIGFDIRHREVGGVRLGYIDRNELYVRRQLDGCGRSVPTGLLEIRDQMYAPLAPARLNNATAACMA